MPGTLEAIAVFAFAVLPGYLFVRFYDQPQARLRSESALSQLARVAFFSGLIAVGTWFFFHGRELVFDLRHRGNLGDDMAHLLGVTAGMLAAGAVLGFVAGHLVAWIAGLVHGAELRKANRSPRPSRRGRAWDWALRRLARLETFRAPTAWDRMWLMHRQRGNWLLVQARMKSGVVVYGAFGQQGYADLSPLHHDLLLDVELVDAGGTLQRVPGSRGVFLPAAEIEALSFIQGPTSGQLTLPSAGGSSSPPATGPGSPPNPGLQ